MNAKLLVAILLVSSIALPDLVQAIEPVQARTIEPVKARTIEPVQARTIQPVQARTIETVQVRTIEPVQARTIETVQARTIEPVQAEAVEPAKVQSVQPAPVGKTSAPQVVAESQKPQHQPESNKKTGKKKPYVATQGQGLNQAQIDAMEAQRRLMWNATGGNMVYR